MMVARSIWLSIRWHVDETYGALLDDREITMESLAYLVVLLFSILMLSGPINIGLTSRRVQDFCAKRRGLTALRRVIFLAIAVIGIFIAINFMYETTPLGPKLFALIAIGGNIYALSREIAFSKAR